MKTLKLKLNERISAQYFPFLAKLGKVEVEKTGAKEIKQEVISKLKTAGTNAIEIVLVALNKKFFILPIKLEKFEFNEKQYKYDDIPVELKKGNIKVIELENKSQTENIDFENNLENKEIVETFFDNQFINNDPTVIPAIKADKKTYKSLLKMSSEIQILPREGDDDNESIKSNSPVEMKWEDDPEEDFKTDWQDFPQERVNMTESSFKIKRPMYDPKEDGPVAQWVTNEATFLDYSMQSERNIVSSILNSLPSMIVNNLLGYLKLNNIRRTELTTQLLIEAIKESNIDSSHDYANSYKTLRFSPTRHYDMKSYFNELKKIFKMSIKETLSEDSYNSFLISFFRLGVPNVVKKCSIFRFFPDEDADALISLAQNIYSKQKDDELEASLNHLKIDKKDAELNYQYGKDKFQRRERKHEGGYKGKNFNPNYDPTFKKRSNEKNVSNSENQEKFCNYCRRKGHVYEDCFKRKRDLQNKGKNSENKETNRRGRDKTPQK